jgi:hypothetical protein
MIKVYTQPNLIEPTKNNEWWIAYDQITNKIIFSPRQGEGFIVSPFILVTAPTKEELDQYIIDHDLIYPSLKDFDITDNI